MDGTVDIMAGKMECVYQKVHPSMSVYIKNSIPLFLINKFLRLTTVCLQIFEGYNFRGQLAIREMKFHWRTLTCMNRRAGYLMILEIRSRKCWICDIHEIYMHRKFVRIR